MPTNYDILNTRLSTLIELHHNAILAKRSDLEGVALKIYQNSGLTPTAPTVTLTGLTSGKIYEFVSRARIDVVGTVSDTDLIGLSDSLGSTLGIKALVADNGTTTDVVDRLLYTPSASTVELRIQFTISDINTTAQITVGNWEVSVYPVSGII